MNAKSILFLSLILITTGIQAQRIKGSDTVLPVAQQTAERFMNRNADSRVTVTGGGTGVGISALMDNTTDIAMASRPIKFSEKMKARAAQKNIEEVIVAYDNVFPYRNLGLPRSQHVFVKYNFSDWDD